MKTHHHQPMIEPLEPRIAPATFVNPTTITYHDVDGDLVTVRLSKPLLADLATANQIFHFDTGAFVASGTPDTTPQQLQLIDFTGYTGVANGVGLTVAVKQAGNGDGLANVGRINATGIDLGGVAVKGDLGSITAGDNHFATPGVKALNVQSIGQFGTSTQAAGGTLASNIAGTLGVLVVKSDLVGAFLSVAGDGTPAADALAKIGAITIGGSVAGTVTDDSGEIRATGGIGTVKIGGDLMGGDGKNSGSIQSLQSIGSVTIGGSLLGAAADNSGRINAAINIGPVEIGGDVAGGAGTRSGSIATGSLTFLGGNIANVTIGGSLLGGIGTDGPDSAFETGSIVAGGTLGRVKIGGDVRANSYAFSGGIHSAVGTIPSIEIGGSLVGGEGRHFRASDDGGQIGGLGIGFITIGGDVVGGAGDGGATIPSSHKVQVRGSIYGGDGYRTANIGIYSLEIDLFTTRRGALSIGGDLRGGAGIDSGRVFDSDGEAIVKIRGGVFGGSGDSSGQVRFFGNTFIGGSLIGGRVSGDRGSIAIAGSVIGGEVVGDFLTSVVIGGSLIAGTEANAGGIFATSINSLTIKGSVIGTAEHHATITAGRSVGSSPYTALGKVVVMGDVRFADILAGQGIDAANPGNPKIGTINIGGDFVASSIVSGAQAGPNGYGVGDTLVPGRNPDIVASIASITIGGQALGTVGGTDHYGIVAERILSLKVGGNQIPLTPGAHNDTRPLGITGDLTIHEI